MSSPHAILPMKTAGTHHFINRTYREGGAFQWARETFVNAVEAQASIIEFGIEWQAVENLGVYRRVIADNGRGMTADELVEFFNTFGGGGKPIGDPHQNFGVGAKTSMLPWNGHGLVVVSWVDGEAAMIWVQRDPKSGAYGLRVFEAYGPDEDEPTLEPVVEPFYDPEEGCDWSKIRPSWMEQNGTVLILLGNDRMDDTVLGDPTRREADIKGLSSYLNRRVWHIEDDRHVTVDELRTTEREKWPRSDAEAHSVRGDAAYDRRTNQRKIEGAEHYVRYPVKTFRKGKLAESGVTELRDGTRISWFLWSGERPAVQSYAAISGYTGTLYNNELYDVTAHAARYRSFGISEREVRQNLWIVVVPMPLGDDQKHGVYPRTDRNSLLLKGGPDAGEPLPINDWGAEFADALPDAIRDRIREARGGRQGSISDPTWRERLAERFGSLWRIPKLRVKMGGDYTVDPTQPGSDPRPHRVRRRARRVRPSGGVGGTAGRLNTGTAPGAKEAARTKVAGGIPTYRFVRKDEIGQEGILAAWHPNDPDFPEGVVLLNVEHPVLESQIERWQAMYPPHHADAIADEVMNVYGQIAVAKVAHSEHLKSILTSTVVEEDLRSNEALTMSLLGLVAEEAVLSTRIGGRFGRKRQQ